MGARKKGLNIHGVFLLDKPAGISSNQALQKVRWLFNARKAGHTGTLDPFATGLLPICLGEATKTAGLIMDGKKVYQAILALGTATATGDTEGEVVHSKAVPELNSSDIEAAMQPFRGAIEQVPPMYSALKQDGKPLYELARQGIVVDRPARGVHIYQLELMSWNPPLLEFSVTCSKGTYVRTLAEDLAEALGSCGHLQALRRLRVEPFDSDQMYDLAQLTEAVEQGVAEKLLLAADSGLPDWPVVALQPEQTKRFQHGNPVDCTESPGKVRVYGQQDSRELILGLGEVRDDGQVYPFRVFASEVAAARGSESGA